jgi:predicted solute-binding protein
MKLSEIKKKMLSWEDFYGADIFETDRIKKAKTKKELDEVMHNYARHMEMRESDARGHFDEFRNSLGLDN